MSGSYRYRQFDAYTPDDLAIHPNLAAEFCAAVNRELPCGLRLEQYACSKRLLALRKQGRIRQTADLSKRIRLTLPSLSMEQRESVISAIRDVYASEPFRGLSEDEIVIHPQRAAAFHDAVSCRLTAETQLRQFDVARWLLRLRKQCGTRPSKKPR